MKSETKASQGIVCRKQYFQTVFAVLNNKMKQETEERSRCQSTDKGNVWIDFIFEAENRKSLSKTILIDLGVF